MRKNHDFADPLEHYRYPTQWLESLNLDDARKKIESGFYILKKNGWLRRGITTATTACAAMNGAIISCYEDVDRVSVLTPSGLAVEVNVEAENGIAVAKKFSGDHAFDVTDGLEIRARVIEKPGIWFGKGVGFRKINGLKQKSVSRSAMRQIEKNFVECSNMYGFKKGVLIEVPEGEKVAEKTGNRKMGITDGISILGTTGFVEPWCDELVKTKIEISLQYDRIAITTGRRAWKIAREIFPNHQPFVFGVHIDEVLRMHRGEKVLVGFPGLLSLWAGSRDLEKIRRRARNMGVEEVCILGVG